MTRDEVEHLNQSLTGQIIEKFNLGIKDLEQLEEELIGKRSSDTGLISSLFTFIVGDLSIKLKSFRIKKYLQYKFSIPKLQSKQLLKLFKRKAALNRRIQFWNRIHQVFHYWHIFHKPFAIIMYLIMLVHIAISIWLGYTWIF